MSDTKPPQTTAKRPMKLSTSVTLMLCAVIGSVLLVVYALYFIQISNATRSGLKDTALAVARTLADDPTIKYGLTQPHSKDIIPPVASRVQDRNDLLFVVVTDMNGIRYSHPKPGNIGSHFIGDDIFPALEGKENVSINHGVLAEALRVFTPVYNEQHKQIGVVAIGISLQQSG
ncbi:Sensor histidine kinase DcuS [Cedecea neteri]|uniref:Sensor histidine kinase DcuS n=1 Tax=Cedecea neteri TaxID=158822 RepID=A0A2X2V682_9ENTR|nr:Sensor histidine kinase DcuS [Cedecea neteri]